MSILKAKMSMLSVMVVLAASLCVAQHANAVPVAPGTTIKLDFSNAGDGEGGSLADWNQTNNGSATLAAGSVIRHGDGAIVDLVSISFSGPGVGGGFNNDPNSNGWVGEAADPYFIPAANDIFFGPGPITTTFNDLDPSLRYNVRVYSLIGQEVTSDTITTTLDAFNTQSVTNSRNTRWAAATLEGGGTVFTDITPNASNAIAVTVQGTSNPHYPLNAIVLEAVAPVPEPATAMLCGLGGLTFFLRRRRTA